MPDSALAAALDANFVATIGLAADLSRAGFRRSFGRVDVAATRLPAAFFNAIFVTEPLADQVDDLRLAVEAMRDEALPFVLHVRADLQAEIEAARSLGLVGEDRLPGYAIEPDSIPDPPGELVIDRVDDASFRPFLETMAAGFGMPLDFAVELFPPRILQFSGMRAYLGSIDGRPVATSMSMRTGDIIGIYSVATHPDVRGRGYGTAMTWATLADAEPGVRAAVLQSSPQGRPVYERMGFRLVREFLELGDA